MVVLEQQEVRRLRRIRRVDGEGERDWDYPKTQPGGLTFCAIKRGTYGRIRGDKSLHGATVEVHMLRMELCSYVARSPPMPPGDTPQC